ncbi:PREDICTED: LETM1 and EF-hand domain-containing protein 1, mitochondrial [Theobroma cacao]|uniref:Mitochondrial proton/calcium exchanger protein n=1 Tax=Theobroma cacao TaxID=3641 RepID=A0AB32WIC5_THECC|nr:PREDICTED: LETM1 and EF-hand domain-containing protein 1, mitochondrial [Theobroma cacao]XP_007028118.2 PREDICTED: LETM1 and EF-hand domain-containing protein 1, mitochondrial [Theobroma cacao]XP_017977501.1 PREDICTED: LETM1 and EF-hand domain-containing protein 1, mitochondrial [Theobroma cacao]XP_017977502.1 PREDICTED: LETM1 and EF-hand domain-containing protein 1, mitochondrial [Theobroma cacao]
MASRVISRRRSCIFSSPIRPTSLIRGFSWFEHRLSSTSEDSRGSGWLASHPYQNTDSKKVALPSVPNNELSYFLAAQFHRSNSFGISKSGYQVGNLDFVSPLGLRWFSQSARSASTATAGQPQLGSGNDGSEQQAPKKVKEASPEECDQAVEGLSTVKAKAKAKQVQDSPKSAQSIIKKVWAAFLGIGPALRTVASMSREDWAKKLRHWKDEFKSTMQHYWLGTKLLWADIRISSRLLVKLANGKGLSRRERQQLTRTTADIFRLVPFAVFIIVPFMEFLLPVFLKLFPNMLPSTFQDKMKEQEALKRRLNARIEYAKFLQDTVKEMAKEIQNSRSGDVKKTAEDLDEFMNKVRTGAGVSNDEILGFAKLFNDELTLDNISRPRLVNMCKYMGISPYGTDAYLRYMLRKRLQEIKNDDKMIQAEGVESLSEAELRQACRDRGLLGLLSVEEMRQQLRDWLDLSLNHSVPSSLLILSRAFSVSGKVRPEEAVQATLSSLPDEVVDTVGVTALPSEDSVSERRRKLEFLEMQEELIKEEEEEEEEEQAKLKESISNEKDVALKEMAASTAKEAQELAKAKTLEKHEQLCELSRALAVLASASSVSREREEFLRLVKKEIQLYNSMVEKEGTKGEEEAKKAYKAAREDSDRTAGKAIGDKVSSALIDRVDAMLQKLEKEIDDVDAKIGDHWRLLDRDYDGKVTPEEVASAAMYLKDTLGKEGIQELISNLSKDREGKILVEDMVKLGSETEDADTAEAGRS